MGSIANSSAGLTYLNQPGGILSNLPAAVPAATLQTASPRDIVSLSEEALQAQQAAGIFGGTTATTATGATTTTSSSPTNAEALQLQQVQALLPTQTAAPPSQT
jgi:hypothetical protein